MGSTMNPRARGDASLRAELKASRDDRQQIRRLFTPPPKPPKPAVVAAGGALWATAEATSITTPSGYPSFSGWTFFDDAIGLGGTTMPSIFTVPVGTYMARVYVDINVSGTSDVWLSANIFSDSAYVTQEFPLNLGGATQHAASYTLGPLPVLNVEGGQMSVSFLSRSGVAPSVSGSCTYNLAKIG